MADQGYCKQYSNKKVCNILNSKFSQEACQNLFDKQYEMLTSGPSKNVLHPIILYENTALSAQDIDNPITFYLFRRP